MCLQLCIIFLKERSSDETRFKPRPWQICLWPCSGTENTKGSGKGKVVCSTCTSLLVLKENGIIIPKPDPGIPCKDLQQLSFVLPRAWLLQSEHLSLWLYHLIAMQTWATQLCHFLQRMRMVVYLPHSVARIKCTEEFTIYLFSKWKTSNKNKHQDAR